MSTKRLVVGVTGASGAIYAQRFLARAVDRFDDVWLILSDQAIQVIDTELGVTLRRDAFDPEPWLGKPAPNLHLIGSKNYFTPPASGSYVHDGMVIVPCSMGTVGRIANGISDDLLSRAADVCLKEKRKLIVVPREMPMHSIMLHNMARLADAGATVLPACPAWYTNPKTLEELADTVVARIFQSLGLDQDIQKQWMVETE